MPGEEEMSPQVEVRPSALRLKQRALESAQAFASHFQVSNILFLEPAERSAFVDFVAIDYLKKSERGRVTTDERKTGETASFTRRIPLVGEFFARKLEEGYEDVDTATRLIESDIDRLSQRGQPIEGVDVIQRLANGATAINFLDDVSQAEKEQRIKQYFKEQWPTVAEGLGKQNLVDHLERLKVPKETVSDLVPEVTNPLFNESPENLRLKHLPVD